MNLSDWLKNYLVYKDQLENQLQSIKAENTLVIANYATTIKKYFCAKTLTETQITQAKKGEIQGFCTENTEENFTFLIKHWKDLVRIPRLILLFVNLKTGEKWVIFPAVHEKIADPATLQQGLRTMFDLANGTINEIQQKKKKPSLFETTEESDEIDE